MRAQCSATYENFANRWRLIRIAAIRHFIRHIPQFTMDSIVLVKQHVIWTVLPVQVLVPQLGAELELESTQKTAKKSLRVPHQYTVQPVLRTASLHYAHWQQMRHTLQAPSVVEFSADELTLHRLQV